MTNPTSPDTGMVELIERIDDIKTNLKNIDSYTYEGGTGALIREAAQQSLASLVKLADALSSLQAEKAQIVAFIRDVMALKCAYVIHGSHAEIIADAIERGDHLQPKVAEGERS